MKSPEDILEEAFLGKKVVKFAYSNDGEREIAIGKTITKIGFGFNYCREDAGMIIQVDLGDGSSSDWIFVYDNEGLEVE